MENKFKLNEPEVQDLSPEDLKKINGGLSPFLLFGGILTIWALVSMI